jgi:predicted nucleic-acid-binding protein
MILVDTNVLIDVLEEDVKWAARRPAPPAHSG